VTNTRLFAGVGAAALLAGALLWHLGRPPTPAPRDSPAPPVVAIAPAAIFAASFTDASGAARALGQFEGKILVLNFWATWCEPCRAEMPAFDRLQDRWAARGVQFVGLSDEPGETVRRFGESLGIRYPLWTGGDHVADLSRRLGNRQRGLPHTVVLDPSGRVVTQRVGPYTEADLEGILAEIAGKSA
jgi:thiol-disulfide isomerase/thioredoxin